MGSSVLGVVAAFSVLLGLAFGALTVIPAGRADAAGAQMCFANAPGSPADFEAVGRNRSSSFGIGDLASMVRLPDGRRLFIFGDTDYHATLADGRPATRTGFGNNSAWLQSGNCFRLLDRPGPGLRSWLIPPETDGTAYWPGASVVVGSRLYVFLSRLFVNSTFGNAVGNAVATFELPSMQLARISTLPFPGKRFYGSGAVYDGGYLYAYASQTRTCSLCFANDMYVSRIPEAKLYDLNAWEYRTADGWSSNPAEAKPALPAAISNPSVQRYGNGFLLVTKTYGFVSPEVKAWFAPKPEGPWQDLGEVFSAPNPPDSFVDGYTYAQSYTYGPVVLPSTSFVDGVLGAYNVGSFAPADAATDSRVGIPRFVSIPLPDPPDAPERPNADAVRAPWAPTFGVDKNGRVTGIDGGPSATASTTNAVGIARTPSGNGTWVATANGAVLTTGDAKYYGSRAGTHLNQAIVGIGATPTGRGYWLVARDGGIFTFGDANFYGSAGAIKLQRPILSMQTTPTGRGYWLIASDGGVFTYGDARFYGSAAAVPSFVPWVGMARTPNGRGYWLVNLLGMVYSYGAATWGGNAPYPPRSPVIGIVAAPGGYRLVDNTGTVFQRATATTTKKIPAPAPLIAAA